ncbi:MAG TPA: hypothetical protein VMC80_00755 [Patescibacteria group bacterium]|nr:hypothetical protein [Patescibacteria group bacterium]
MPETSLATCIFDESYWNDQEQRNYRLYRCNNPENTGGTGSHCGDDGRLLKHEFHDSRTYSCWYKNKGMRYRCFGEPEEIAKCPMAKPI